MQFEWAVKHEPPRNVGGIKSRIKKLYSVMNKERWTSNSPLASDVPLEEEFVEEVDIELGVEFEVEVKK